MSERINTWLALVVKFGVLALAVATPLLFWNLTSEFYETPKFLALGALTLVLLFLWSLRFLLEGRVKLTRSPLDLGFILLLAICLISTYFAVSRPVAIMGNLPRLHGSLASYVLYILFYFILVSNIKKVADVKTIINFLLGSGVIVAVISLLSYAGLYFPVAWMKAMNFTPAGTSFSTAALLVMLLPFLLANLMNSNVVTKNASLVLLVLFSATIALVGPVATQVAAVIATLLILATTPQDKVRRNIGLVAVPVVVGVVLVALSIIPVGGSRNPLYQQAQNFPRELQLDFATSWKVSVSAFRDRPFWGSGPSSYLFDFTQYKPAEFNLTKFWNIRFDQSFNEYLEVLATLGLTGLLAMLLITFVFISNAVRRLVTGEPDALNTGLAVSGISFFVLLALHPSTLVLWVIGILIIAGFMVANKDLTEDLFLRIGAHRQGDTSGAVRFDLLPVLVLLVVLIGVVLGMYTMGKYAVADYYHRMALNAVAQNDGIGAYNALVTAENLNPNVDVYRSNLAQTNFALANTIAATKGPTDASPAGSLTDQDKQNIQTLLSQAITEGRVATVISPQNPSNWEVLGSIYRQIAGVADNALAFSLDSYGRAIQLDPLNPLLRLSAGGIYYSVKNYDMAIRFFTDAVQLKPDYANGYFNLAIALRDKGDYASAQQAAAQVVALSDPKSDDYKVATALFNDLKNKNDASAAAQAAAQKQAEGQQGNLNQASQTNSALNQKNLPQVLSLPQPENIATPAAVKK